MAAPRRIQRINSLLKEVISDVIRLDLKNYNLPDLLTITEVSTSKDLQHAKVFVSLINGNKDEKDFLVEELQRCSSAIARMSSKKVVMRYFPNLTFKIDNTLDDYMKINDILASVNKDNTDESVDTEYEEVEIEEGEIEDNDESN